jgi:Helix-turn-helix domain of resolvase
MSSPRCPKLGSFGLGDSTPRGERHDDRGPRIAYRARLRPQRRRVDGDADRSSGAEHWRPTGHRPNGAGERRKLQRDRAAAKAKVAGVYKGRPTSSRIRELKSQGMRPADIARALKIGRASVYRVLGQKDSS